jgi:hypothetical protein
VNQYPVPSVLRDVATMFLNMPSLNLKASQLFAGVEPDTAIDPCITVSGVPGEGGIHTQDKPRPAIELPRVQVAVRSRDYESAEALAETLYANMWTQGQTVLNGNVYANIYPLSPPAQMPGPPDENGRYGIFFRARARRKPA